MKSVMNLLDWGWFKFTKCILGIFICSLAINLFIIPNNLYTGGTLGLAQLIRSFIVEIFNVDFKFDISSIIYYVINVPLFLIAYKRISKIFFVRTLFAVSLNSLFLILIPIPSQPLTPELITNVMIGGIIGGIGIGMVLSTASSTGGTDIIGIVLSEKNRNFSVGNISLVFNVLVYSICGIKYGAEIMIYSIIFAVFETIMTDKNHQQNICSEVFIFTKVDPKSIIEFIKNELGRDATFWEAIGGYTKTETYIIYSVLSKYERMRLERHINEFDEKAFMVSNDGVEIKGEFKKNYILIKK